MMLILIILFVLSKTQNYVLEVTLSTKDSKRFERSVYWNDYKTKSENKNMRNEYRYFPKSNFVGVNRLFILVYSNQDDNAKRYKAKRYYLRKAIIKKFNVIINLNKFYDHPIDSDIK